MLTLNARQQAVVTAVESGGHVVVNAAPGTGKTYTLGGVAHAFPGKPIINLCFNRNTKLQADEKLPSWTKNYTFHGLAFGHVGKYYQKQLGIKLNPKAISEAFDCDDKEATVVKYTLRKYAVSDSVAITGWHVPFESFKGLEKSEQEAFKERIVTLSRKAWNGCMYENKRYPKLGIEHDFYLKRFVEEGAKLPGRFDIVMVDESQDMVPVNIKALEKMYGQRICVGDERQELYRWRETQNVKDKLHFDYRCELIDSNRFGPEIAEVANQTQALLPTAYPDIVGIGGPSKVTGEEPDRPHAILCRSNAGLLGEALNAIRQGKKIHVIGSLMDSVLLMESAWYLSIGDDHKVKHPTMKMIGTWDALLEMAKEDQDFKMAAKRVAEYGGRIPYLCEELKMAGETSRQRADVILSTVHKCVHPDTLVETPNGLMKIRDIPNEGEIATPFGMTSHYHDWFTREESDTLAITTKRGYQIEITTDHGMTIWSNGEHIRKNGSELGIGDWLRVRVGMTCDVKENPQLPTFNEVLDVRSVVHRLPETMNESFAEFLGLMVADGTIYNRGFKLLKRDRDVADRFRDLVSELFGYEANYFDNEGTPGYDVSSVHIATWLKSSFNGLCPNNKEIPDIVLRSHLRIQAAFLKGLFEDGTVNVKAGHVDHIHFDSKFESLARTVQTMLLRLEIISSINTHTTRDPLKITTLYIYGENMRTFRDRIGFVSGRKNRKLDDLPNFKQSLDCVPITINELKSIRNFITLTEYQNARSRKRISRHKASLIIDRAGQDESVSFLIERMRWHYEKITSITASRSETICVTVPFGHRFLQNGFDGWNSKGDEFSHVKLADDFPDLIQWRKNERRYMPNISEICVFFVAVTRAQQVLYTNSITSQLKTWKELLD